MRFGCTTGIKTRPRRWCMGHHRWGVENHLFNELTQFYHLEHCPHHHPVAIMAWLLILVLAFTLFELFVRLHGKLWRQGTTTLQDIASALFEALARWEEIEPLWSGGAHGHQRTSTRKRSLTVGRGKEHKRASGDLSSRIPGG